jgi:hypothetical protein
LVTIFITWAWWHHVTKGRWLSMVLFFFASWVVHEHLISYVALFFHSSDLLLLSLFLLCKGLVDNIYPKEYTNDSK